MKLSATIWHRREMKNITSRVEIDHTDKDAFTFNIAQAIASKLNIAVTDDVNIEIVIKDRGELS